MSEERGRRALDDGWGRSGVDDEPGRSRAHLDPGFSGVHLDPGRSGAHGGGWAEEALDRLFRRVGETAEQVGARFPLYADPADGRWTSTGRGSWTGGFWAGLLWLRARHTDDDRHRSAAATATAALAPWTDADTATRGLILWYGTAPATGDEAAGVLRARAARAALAAWEPKLGLVPWGAALGGPRLRARADGVPGLVPLLASAGPRAGRPPPRICTATLSCACPAKAPGGPARPGAGTRSTTGSPNRSRHPAGPAARPGSSSRSRTACCSGRLPRGLRAADRSGRTAHRAL